MSHQNQEYTRIKMNIKGMKISLHFCIFVRIRHFQKNMLHETYSNK